MFSWLHSTFSNALPSIPLNLQHRFLSFVLKRALGRFVHSDQLDAFQIDTQIRNGKIEISNIHLATNVSMCIGSTYVERSNAATTRP